MYDKRCMIRFLSSVFTKNMQLFSILFCHVLVLAEIIDIVQGYANITETIVIQWNMSITTT